MVDQLICLSTSTQDALVVPGSEVRWCHLCADELWVAPSGIALLDAGAAEPLCIKCASGLVTPEAEIVLHHGTRQEMSLLGLTDAEIDTLLRLLSEELS